MAESKSSDEVLIDDTDWLQASSDEFVDQNICSIHIDKNLEYFCNDHIDQCCIECLNTKHKSCSNTLFIPDVSSNILYSQAYIHLKGEIDKLAAITACQLESMTSKVSVNDEYRSKALANMKTLKKHLSKQKKKTKLEVARLHERNANRIQAREERCQATITEVNNMASELSNIVESGDKNQLYVLVNKFNQRAFEIENELELDQETCTIDHFEFNVDEKLQNMESAISALWSMSRKQSIPNSKARYLNEIRVKCDDDQNDCYINGISMLADGKLVITDRDNIAVKLFDLKMNKYLFRYLLSSIPTDITKIGEYTVAVAQGEKGKIELLRISNSIVSTKTLCVPKTVIAGLCSNGEHIFAACKGPGSVKIVDMSGNVLKTISRNASGKTLFTAPRYIALSHDQAMVYITDSEANTVITLNIDNQKMVVYKDDKLICPLGITVDRNGEVFVCSHDSQTIHQLSPSGRFIRILLDRKDLPINICAIDHCDTDNTLFVSSNSIKRELRNVVRVFKLQ